MNITQDARLNSLGEPDEEPQQTDNGPKPGDGEIADQDAITLPTERDPAPDVAGRNRVLAAALQHRGTVEDPVGSNRQPFGAAYGWNGVAWCNIFVSQMGHDVAGSYGLLGRFALTTACAHWWDSKGRFGREPRPGAVVFFDWSGSKRINAIDHVGLVISALPNGLVRTVEGNAAITGRSDGVWLHDRNPVNIVGYGYPAYAAVPTRPGAGPVRPGAGPVRPGPSPVRPATTPPPKPSVPSPMPPFPGTLKLKSTGEAVRTLQRRLVARGWRKVVVDGDFGPVTRGVVMAFQKEKGLEVDGVVGPKTWAALWIAPITP